MSRALRHRAAFGLSTLLIGLGLLAGAAPDTRATPVAPTPSLTTTVTQLGNVLHLDVSFQHAEATAALLALPAGTTLKAPANSVLAENLLVWGGGNLRLHPVLLPTPAALVILLPAPQPTVSLSLTLTALHWLVHGAGPRPRRARMGIAFTDLVHGQLLVSRFRVRVPVPPSG